MSPKTLWVRAEVVSSTTAEHLHAPKGFFVSPLMNESNLRNRVVDDLNGIQDRVLRLRILRNLIHSLQLLEENYEETMPGLPFATVHELRRLSYQDYLETEHWQEARGRAIRAAGHRCQICNAQSNEEQLQVHHRTYDNKGTERLRDLTVLCVDCHALYHENGQ